MVSIESFSDLERSKAQDLLLTVELQMKENVTDREVVLLEAESEAAIRSTHGRYFYDLKELIEKL